MSPLRVLEKAVRKCRLSAGSGLGTGVSRQLCNDAANLAAVRAKSSVSRLHTAGVHTFPNLVDPAHLSRAGHSLSDLLLVTASDLLTAHRCSGLLLHTAGVHTAGVHTAGVLSTFHPLSGLPVLPDGRRIPVLRLPE